MYTMLTRIKYTLHMNRVTHTTHTEDHQVTTTHIGLHQSTELTLTYTQQIHPPNRETSIQQTVHTPNRLREHA